MMVNVIPTVDRAKDAGYSSTCIFTRLKTLNLFPVDENRLQQCCTAPHEHCCQQYVAVLLSITTCNNIVDNNVHGVQHNIVESCYLEQSRET